MDWPNEAGRGATAELQIQQRRASSEAQANENGWASSTGSAEACSGQWSGVGEEKLVKKEPPDAHEIEGSYSRWEVLEEFMRR